jgi:F-type H+-transporting ATPase subunit a
MGDPIHQFQLKSFFSLGHIGPYEIAFTNSALFMLIAILATAALMLIPTRNRALVPSRAQSVAEISYEFVADTIQSTAGKEGMKFFPLVFSLFMFILVANLFGMFPYFFTVTSHIIVTAMMALLVFFTVIIYGVYKNGLRFLKLFVPSGIPWPVLIAVVPIEIISFLSRPLSHSLRLFGNILAGHIVLKVFGGMVVALLGAGAWGIIAIAPFGMAVALTGLEFLVAALQAFVFAVLTCVYLHDAIHPGH